MNDWYKESFGEDYLLVYQHRSKEQAKQEVDQLIGWLDLKPQERILDLCCGSGRHTIALAKAGFHAIGFDLSEVLLHHALKDSQGLPIYFVHGDMRRLPFVEDSFHVVLNLFTSFGYFDQNESNRLVLKEISRVLKPNGRFCIDFLNASYVRKNLIPESKRKIGDTVVHEVREIKDDFVTKTLRVVNPNRERVYYERVKLYSKLEMLEMLGQVGLEVQQIFGNFSGQPFSEDSERMILVGRSVK